MDISDPETERDSNMQVQYGPETGNDWTERLRTMLKNEFDKVNSIGKLSTMFYRSCPTRSNNC